MNIKQVLFLALLFIGLTSYSQIEYKRTVESFDNVSFLVKISLKKGDITGTSKVQEEINPGYAIEVLKGANSTSSYQENVIKLIWENLPTDSIIELEYLASPNNTKVKKLDIEGYFLYLKDDQVIKYTSTPTYFTIEDNEVAMYDPKKIEEPTEDTGVTDEDVIPEHLKEKEEVEVLAVKEFGVKPTEKPTIKTEIVTESEEVTNTTEKNLSPELTLTDEELTTEEVLDESLGENSEELFTKTEEADLTIPVENKLDIADEELTKTVDSSTQTEVTNNETDLTPIENTANELKPIKAETVVETEQTIAANKIAINETTNNSDNGTETINELTTSEVTNDIEVITNNKSIKPETNPEDETVIEGATIESNGVEIKAVEFKGTTTDNETAEASAAETELTGIEAEAELVETSKTMNTTAPSEADLSTEQTQVVASNTAGIYYKVQICALRPKNEVEASYFNKKHNLTDEVSKEDHAGWKKYTIQKYTVYKDARDARNIVIDNHSVVGAFVTAYNNGVRIHVREALDITGQKWYR